MNLDSIGAANTLGSVCGAIASAASATGVDFGYLLAQARAESGLKPTSQSRTSSAGGLYQFIDSTWLSVLKQHGAANGLSWAANAIEWIGGKLGIRDAATRASVLALKHDPSAAALMAGAHAIDNKAGLEAGLGRAVGSTELYLAHFLGLGGATRFLRAMARNPATSAAGVSPDAAHANRKVFFDQAGAARSLAQVYQHFREQFSDPTPTRLAPMQAAALPISARPAALPSPDYVRAAYMLLAELGE